MSQDLKGKVAIITASSTGIGKAIAQRLSADGCHVVISSRKKQNIDQTVNEINSAGGSAIGVVCHVGKKEDRLNLINQTVKKFGGIDYLICNAAVSTHVGSFLEAKEKEVQKMWDINYMAVFLLIQESVEYIKQRKDSAIVILSSYTAYDLSLGIPHYAITKTALVALTKVVAKELLADNVRVNCVAPGLIKTEFSGMLWKGKEKEAMDDMGVKRLGEVEDIAGVVRFLVGKDSAYMTGECLGVVGRNLPRL